MRVLLDADGVLVDFLTPLLATIKRRFNLDYTEADLRTWYVFEQVAADLTARSERLGIDGPFFPKLCERMVWGAWDHGPELEPYPEARPAVDALRALGADIYVVTAMAPSFAERRFAMLARCFDIPSDHVVFTTAKHVVSGDLFVDDRLENVQSWAEHNPRNEAVLFARSYNQGPHSIGVQRGGWDTVLSSCRYLSRRT